MIKRSLTLCLLIGMSVIFIFNASIELSSWKSPATQRLSSLDDDDSIETNNILLSFKMSEYVFFALLVLQTGCQPLLIKLFMPPTIVRTTVVLSQELSKFILSILILASSVDWQESMRGWTISDAVMAAGIPAVLYVAQNYCNLMATQVLPPVTFVVLNQTKTLSTAWCCFILLGQKQSQIQVMALILLVCSVLVVQAIIPLTPSRYERENSRESKLLEEKQLTIPEDPEEARSLKSEATTSLLATTEKSSHVPASEECIQGSIGYDEAARQLSMGVLPALFASFLSGLSGTLVQRTLQTHERSPHVFNMELAVFSSMFLSTSLLAGSPDCQKITTDGISAGWTWWTWVPVVSNGFGGILVGLVTKYQGAVVKSFAMIFGMVISGVLQQLILARNGGGLTREQLVGAMLGALSLYLHARYPA